MALVGWLSLFGFRCVSLSFSTRQSFETKTDDTGARYVCTIWPCVLIIMIIK